jgi:rhodanese-related sulfurtransferase
MKVISTSELQELASADPYLLIVNTLPRDAFEETNVPRAISIPQEDPDFVEKVARAAGTKEKKLVVYCASQQYDTCEKATKKLENAGFTSVLTYKGGAEAWKREAHAAEAGS